MFDVNFCRNLKGFKLVTVDSISTFNIHLNSFYMTTYFNNSLKNVDFKIEYVVNRTKLTNLRNLSVNQLMDWHLTDFCVWIYECCGIIQTQVQLIRILMNSLWVYLAYSWGCSFVDATTFSFNEKRYPFLNLFSSRM